MGKPEEVAQVVLFLVSDHSNYIMGQTIIVDGGNRVTIMPISECALNHVRFRAAMHPAWYMAECGILIREEKKRRSKQDRPFPCLRQKPYGARRT
jgi:hypothetical protein